MLEGVLPMGERCIPRKSIRFNTALKAAFMVACIGETIAYAKDPLPALTVPYSLGVAAHFNSQPYNPAYTDQTFDAVRRAHFSLVRFVPDWQHIEKSRGKYDFTISDWLTGNFTSRGLRPVLSLGLNNPLYQVNCRIRTSEQRIAFGNFVRAMVAHYKGRQVIWEIWNEPNIPHFWKPLPGETLPMSEQITEYLELLNYVVPIIRETDPDALVIGPGAANYNTAWLRDALSAGLLQHLDGLSVHPYQGKERPELVIAQHEQVQKWIPADQRHKPIFFTEWGYSTGTGPNEVSEKTQADYAQRQYMLSLMLGIRGHFIYSLANASLGSPCETPNACYGLFTKTNGTPKPAYFAIKNLANQLIGYHFTRRIFHSEPTLYTLEFKNNTGDIKHAVWRSSGEPMEFVLPNGKTGVAGSSVQVL